MSCSLFPVTITVRKMLEDTQLVWVRDAAEGYIQGRITEIGTKEFEVTPTDRKYPKRTCHFDDIRPRRRRQRGRDCGDYLVLHMETVPHLHHRLANHYFLLSAA